MMAGRLQPRSRGYAQGITSGGFEELVPPPPVACIDGPTISRTEILQGGCDLELSSPSKRIAIIGRGDVRG
jgi:hypothetical protein